MLDPYDQHGYRVRLDWGAEGVAALAAGCAVVVVVDVLSFGTAVSIALDRGAAVLPLRWRDARAAAAARSAGAVLASPRRGPGPSLSPSSLLDLPAGVTLALPSPNGATLSAMATELGCLVLAGCLRNAPAVAAAAARLAGDDAIGVVAAGERWRLAGAPLRPALEDHLGAGAVADRLAELGLRPMSPEAVAAVAGFRAARSDGLAAVLGGCASGRELIADGFGGDVRLAAEHAVTERAPLLHDGVFRGANAAEWTESES